MNNNKQIYEKKVGESLNTNEQVKQEFEHAEDIGESELEQLKTELGEQKYLLSSPMDSVEDVDFTNRNADQQGEAFGLDYQENEPLDTEEKIERRDENRWELNPASADDYESLIKP